MTCYVVLGPSRSGTSLCTGMISRMGVWIGEELKEDNRDRPVANPKYYEDLGQLDLVLHGKGTAEEVVDRLSFDRPKWGFKLSRLNKWYLFKPLILEPRFIVTHRNHADNCHSYKKWVSSVLNTGLSTSEEIAYHYRMIEEIVGKSPRISIQFENWFDSRREDQLKRLSEFIGTRFDRSVFSLIDPKLWRSRVSLGD